MCLELKIYQFFSECKFVKFKTQNEFKVVEYFRFIPGNRRKAEVPKIPGKRPSFEESGPLMIHQQEFRFFQKMLRLKKTVSAHFVLL